MYGTGTRAAAKTSVQIFGAGAGGGSSSAKDVDQKEGDPSACASASPDATTAPAQCGAAVRLELYPIRDAAKSPPQPDKPAGAAPVVEAQEPACPQGLVLTKGKCAAPAEDAPHLCRPGD